MISCSRTSQLAVCRPSTMLQFSADVMIEIIHDGHSIEEFSTDPEQTLDVLSIRCIPPNRDGTRPIAVHSTIPCLIYAYVFFHHDRNKAAAECQSSMYIKTDIKHTIIFRQRCSSVSVGFEISCSSTNMMHWSKRFAQYWTRGSGFFLSLCRINQCHHYSASHPIMRVYNRPVVLQNSYSPVLAVWWWSYDPPICDKQI